MSRHKKIQNKPKRGDEYIYIYIYIYICVCTRMCAGPPKCVCAMKQQRVKDNNVNGEVVQNVPETDSTGGGTIAIVLLRNASHGGP